MITLNIVKNVKNMRRVVMTNNLTAKDIVKLMDENNITLHDLASEQNKILYVYSIEDIICRINDSNENME